MKTTSTLPIRPANFTRHSPDFVAKFKGERRHHLIPLYALLQLSDFAREGIARSGSYRFADHLYSGRPSGRGWVGCGLDWLLLQLPAARAMRQRCFEATAAMRGAFQAHAASGTTEPFRLLTAPCGLPRDVRDFAQAVATESSDGTQRIAYTGLDLDPEVIEAARPFLHGCPLGEIAWRQGDALDPATWPTERQHCISSTGLGEFLEDTALTRFYANVHRALAPGGLFFTSATAYDRRSDKLLRLFELETHYRTEPELKRLLAGQAWSTVETRQHPTRLQTFVLARKS